MILKPCDLTAVGVWVHDQNLGPDLRCTDSRYVFKYRLLYRLANVLRAGGGRGRFDDLQKVII